MDYDEKYKQVSQISIMITTDPSGPEIFIDDCFTTSYSVNIIRCGKITSLIIEQDLFRRRGLVRVRRRKGLILLFTANTSY